MAELKTQKNKASVKAFIDNVENDQRRKDAKVIMKMMRDVTGKRPSMWGSAIVGYDGYPYTYPDGREIEWFKTGFSPRKQSTTLYIMDGFRGYAPLLKKLGKHKTGKSCLYINKLEDVDLDVLRELIERSVAHVSKQR